MSRKIYLIPLTAIVLCFPVEKMYAQAASFLNVNPDARTMALANTGTVMPASAFSIWNNGANAVFSENTLDAAVGYGNWQPDLSGNTLLSFAGYGKISKNIALMAGVRHFKYKSYETADPAGNVTGTFTPKELVAGVGISVRILPLLSASVNANYLTSDVGGPKKGGAFAADVALLLRLKAINIGLTASNLGSKIDYGGATRYALPATVKLGVGFSRVYAQRHCFSANVQGGVLLKESGVSVGAGVEYLYNNLFSVRGGYHYGDKNRTTPSYGSAGLGVRFLGIKLDAAYLFAGSDSPLRNSFMLSLGWGF